MEDRYVKGLITAYGRVLNMMNELDPDNIDKGFNIIRKNIDTALYGYKCMIDVLNLDNQIPNIKEYIQEIDEKIQNITLSKK